MSVCVLVTQSCPTPCEPVDGRPPGSPVHGISQTRILEWVAISFSRGPLHLLHCKQILYHLSHQRSAPPPRKCFYLPAFVQYTALYTAMHNLPLHLNSSLQISQISMVIVYTNKLDNSYFNSVILWDFTEFLFVFKI